MFVYNHAMSYSAQHLFGTEEADPATDITWMDVEGPTVVDEASLCVLRYKFADLF